MNMTQEERLLALDTPLGKDVLFLKSLQGSEGLSRLYHFDLEVFTEGPAIPFANILDQPVSIRIKLFEDNHRFFHGIVNRFVLTQSESGIFHYRARVVPWLWLLTRQSNCRIFQNMTIPDILASVFEPYKKLVPFNPVKFLLHNNDYPQREYCVQYRETDFQFVSRLMEQYGIFYYFTHEEDQHTLVLGDDPTVHQPFEPFPEVSWEPLEVGQHEEDVITHLEFEQEPKTGAYAHTDYNFETPQTTLFSQVPSLVDVGHSAEFEHFDFPGEYNTKGEGLMLARLRMEELEAGHFRGRGSSTCKNFSPGLWFQLKDYQPENLNQRYLLSKVDHSAVNGQAGSSSDGSETEAAYHNTFVCQPLSVPYRPPHTTPKPCVQGPQTAIVCGKTDEEIWTDQYGRVKVAFHWDRESQKDEHSSCWVRVAQGWAGKQWGTYFIPRIGDEVIVEFLEGDPDRPMITGAVYNASNQHPYLGNSKYKHAETFSGIKTQTSPGGNGFNELRFQDAKGKEQVFVHAQRRMDQRVRGSLFETVGGDRNCRVGNEKGGNQYTTIANESHKLIEKAEFLEIREELNTLVSKLANLRLNEGLRLNINSLPTVVGVNGLFFNSKEEGMHVGGKFLQFAVEQGLHLQSKEMRVESNKITLAVGQNCIIIDESGVRIHGSTVKINDYSPLKVDLAQEPSKPEKGPDIKLPQEALTASSGKPVVPGTGGGGGKGRKPQRTISNDFPEFDLPTLDRPDVVLPPPPPPPPPPPGEPDPDEMIPFKIRVIECNISPIEIPFLDKIRQLPLAEQIIFRIHYDISLEIIDLHRGERAIHQARGETSPMKGFIPSSVQFFVENTKFSNFEAPGRFKAKSSNLIFMAFIRWGALKDVISVNLVDAAPKKIKLDHGVSSPLKSKSFAEGMVTVKNFKLKSSSASKVPA